MGMQQLQRTSPLRMQTVSLLAIVVHVCMYKYESPKQEVQGKGIASNTFTFSFTDICNLCPRLHCRILVSTVFWLFLISRAFSSFATSSPPVADLVDVVCVCRKHLDHPVCLYAVHLLLPQLHWYQKKELHRYNVTAVAF